MSSHHVWICISQKFLDKAEMWLRISVMAWSPMGPQTIWQPIDIGKQDGILIRLYIGSLGVFGGRRP